MKFVKGMITGMIITAGAAMVYTEYTIGPNKNAKTRQKNDEENRTNLSKKEC